jgi:hypothetical protein
MLRIFYFFLFGYWDRPVVSRKPRNCPSTYCDAIPSPLCWSGRCRAHCLDRLEGCKCESSGLTKEEAQMIADHRKINKDILEAVDR